MVKSDIVRRGGLEDLAKVPIDGQEFVRITINPESYRANPQLCGKYLTKVHEFLDGSYKEGDVIARKHFAAELKNQENQNYTIDALVDPRIKEVVAAVSHGVANVPVSTTDFTHDGDNQFTAVYYARARGNGKTAIAKKYEPALKWLLEEAIESGKEYSASKRMLNVGLLTADSRHKRVWDSLAKNYGGGYLPSEKDKKGREGVGVPTLSEKVGQDYGLNFKEHHKERLVAIPSNGGWTKSMLINIWAMELEEEYAHKKPGEQGYMRLTTAKYFKDFVSAVQKLPGDNVTFTPIIKS